jgi:dihydrodipicolinate synthase/N-acetylneuraminate lyase
MTFKMKGVVPPMITPFTEDGQVDYEGLKILVNFLRDKVDGIFITGSYGSGAMMSLAERKKVTETAVKTAQGKISVIAMVGTTNDRESVELAKHAEAAGVDAIAAVGPYYFTHNDDSICYFFEDLVKNVKDIPVYVYNNPKFQGYPMSLKVLQRMKSLGVSGIKDATFDILAHATYHRVLKDENFDVVLGTEAMWLSARALGTEAFIPGLANAFPEICQKMYQEGMAGDYEACRKTQFEVNKMRDIMYLAKSTQLAIYAMLEARGILKCYPRAPFIPATDVEVKAIRDELIKMGAL